MNVKEAQDSFKQQSLALTGHKNIVLQSDMYNLFTGPQVCYRRIKTRSDWFLVKTVTSGYALYDDNDESVTEIRIIKVSSPIVKDFSTGRVWTDLNRVMSFVDQSTDWTMSQPTLTQRMSEQDVVELLETSMFREYKEIFDDSGTIIRLRTY